MTIPQQMQALVVLEDGHGPSATATEGATRRDLARLVALRRIPVPTPGPGQLLVKVALAPVNPSDELFIEGRYGQPRVRGRTAGFEGMGVVVAAGEGAASPRIGQRVSFFAIGSGTWAEYALTDPSVCIEAEDALSDEQAASLLVNPLTAIAMIDLAVRAKAGAVLLTAGASQLARMMIPLAASRGIAPIAVVRNPAHEPALRALGAAQVLVTAAADFPRQLGQALQTHKPRVLLDAVGDQTSADIFLAMPAHSRWIAYGILSPTGPCLPDVRPLVFSGKHIEGFWLTRWLREVGPSALPEAAREAQRLILAGTWSTQFAKPIALADALQQMPTALGSTGKALLAPHA